MKTLAYSLAVLAVLVLAAPRPAPAADDSKVKAATSQVETGAKKIGDGRIAEGVEETAKGIGHTVVEGGKYTADKLKESGRAAEPQARSAWASTKDAVVAWGGSVRDFFSRLFTGK